ncbi:hypothetical protein CCMSSC00406_0008981 [Pleurotus cornucopiae]|uniref:Uncharacterized protein n=1 Tax=Pleurotus cornucopiae TaxID=5321 RepID=A0ACB7J8U8_PLECO|nr:hypothetical protein CCMSSC00406_0008981 [Pleurotus cornucopiae]
MVPSLLRPLFSAVFLSALAQAANDWSKPCFQGQCEYDLPFGGPSSGTLKIMGNSIADITPAAGWEILGCSPHALSQEIILVCTTSRTSDCEHLDRDAGAVGKIVRLPENCGPGPFAYISKAWIPENQSISSDVQSRILRRNGRAPLVKALRIDTDFESAQRAGNDPVHFTLYGANIPGMDMSDRRRGFIDELIDKVSKPTNFDLPPITFDLPPIRFNKKMNLFNQSSECPPAAKATVNVDINTEATVFARFSIYASGTVFPHQKLDSFKAVFGVTANLSGGLDLSTELSGVLDSGKIKLLELAIPGFGFPGFITVGPALQVDAEAKAMLDVVADLSVGLNYQIVNAQFEFPPKADSPKGDFLLPLDTPLKLSVSSSVKATGSVEGHIIPRLNLGLDAFHGAVGANVFFEFDTSAKASLNANAAAEVATAIPEAPTSTESPEKQNVARQVAALPPNASQEPAGSVPASIEPSALTQPSIIEASSTTTISTIGKTSSFLPTSSSAPVSTTTGPGVTDASSTTFEPSSSNPVSTSQVDMDSGASTSVGGCFDISAGFDINAGADASFFGLFKAGKKISLFSKQFNLFKKCFGEQANARRGLRTKARFFGRRVGLVCSLPGIKPEPLADQVIGANAIKAV